MADQSKTGFVTDGSGRFLIQKPADNEWGFSLFSDDQSWPGGFDSGFLNWYFVSPERVPKETHEELGWILADEYEGTSCPTT